MKYDKNEILEFVMGVLGENADGIYIDNEEVQNGCDDENSLYTAKDGSSAILSFGDDYREFHGLTRVVISPDNKDYIIKMPITGVYEFSKGEFKIVAKFTEDCENPSDYERTYYEELSKEEKQIFLPLIYVADYNGIPVYIQKKIDVSLSDRECEEEALYGYVKELTKENYQEIKEVLKSSVGFSYVDFPERFAYDVIQFYGKRKAETFFRKLFEIDDLHEGNVGYINRRPVVFDYGGYSGKESSWCWLNKEEDCGE